MTRPGSSETPTGGAQSAETVRHEIIQPKGYLGLASDDPRPWFDDESRVIVLLCHEDGSVTWEMRAHGEVLEPEHAAKAWLGRVQALGIDGQVAPKQRCHVHTFVTIDKCGCPPDPTLVFDGPAKAEGDSLA